MGQGPGQTDVGRAGNRACIIHRQQFGRRPVRSPACPGLVCLVHALLPLVRETHSSSQWHSFVQLFTQASHKVAAPPFRSATSTTSTRRGRRRRAFVRGNLNRSSVRGGRRIHSLRKLSAVQAYRIGRRQVLPRRR